MSITAYGCKLFSDNKITLNARPEQKILHLKEFSNGGTNKLTSNPQLFPNEDATF